MKNRYLETTSIPEINQSLEYSVFTDPLASTYPKLAECNRRPAQAGIFGKEETRVDATSAIRQIKLEMQKQDLATNSLPETGFVRLPKLLAIIPFSRTTLYALIKKGKFPAPTKLSERVSAWEVGKIREYIQQSK